jgi:hypothetical protein
MIRIHFSSFSFLFLISFPPFNRCHIYSWFITTNLINLELKLNCVFYKPGLSGEVSAMFWNTEEMLLG